MGGEMQRTKEPENLRAKGTDYEALASAYLKRHGMRIVAQNFRSGRTGEIDIIGWHAGFLVFVEVKYRKTSSKGSATEAVTPAKQRQICNVADYYRCRYHIPTETPVRYDVIAIQGEELTWLRNAFPHRYR